MDMESPLHGGSPCTLYSAFASFIVTCGARTKFMKFSRPPTAMQPFAFLAEPHKCRHIPTQQLSEKYKKKKKSILFLSINSPSLFPSSLLSTFRI